MSATLTFRGGGQETLTDATLFEEQIRGLVGGLCSEHFARPDYEHCRASVCHSSGWYIEVNVDGLIVLGKLKGGPEPDRYLYGLPREELVQLLLLLANGEIETILARTWESHPGVLRSCRGDFYLWADSEDMTDLHRAATKGDLEWMRAELASGTDVNARDRGGATPLHLAALAGWTDACRLLLEAGADSEAQDNEEETPASYAKLANEFLSAEEVAELVRLLRGEADPG